MRTKPFRKTIRRMMTERERLQKKPLICLKNKRMHSQKISLKANRLIPQNIRPMILLKNLLRNHRKISPQNRSLCTNWRQKPFIMSKSRAKSLTASRPVHKSRFSKTRSLLLNPVNCAFCLRTLQEMLSSTAIPLILISSLAQTLQL